MERPGDRASVPTIASPASGVEQANRLVRLAQELAVSLEPARTAELAARGLAELAGGGLVLAYLVAPDGRLRLEALGGAADREALLRVPSLVRRAYTGRTMVAADADELADLRGRGIDVVEGIAAPLEPVGEPLGVLAVAVPAGGQVAVHPGLVQTVARLAGASLANGRRLAATLAEARRDPLTELGNHRAFHEHLETALRRTLAADGALTLALFDLDNFKFVNDREGHPAGDAVLHELAGALSKSRRAREELFRVGGDEFALVVEGGVEAAARVADRMRSVVRARWSGRGLTLSAGLAAFPADALTKDELVHKADLALYAAKRAGKDTAITFGSDVLGAAGRHTAEVLYEDLHDRMSSPDVRAGVLGALSRVTSAVRALGRETTVDAMLRSAARQLTAAVGGTACVISRLDGETLRDAAVFSPPPWELDEGNAYLLGDYPLTIQVLEDGEPRAVSRTDENVDPAEAFVLDKIGMQSVLIMPVRVGGGPWGLAEVYDARPRRFRPADVGLAELVVGHVEALLAQFEQGAMVERVYRETLASLSNALEIKDDYTGHHAEKVCELALGVAGRLGLGGEGLRAVELGALLHDIGKIRVPEAILNKPGPLSAAEWEVMRTHPEAGERILAPIASLRDVLPIVRSSHERWDGAGYPDRLAGDEIPLGARIVAVCDAYRAMVEPRPYRGALSREAATAELEENAGQQFDPACVEGLVAVLSEQERPGVVRLHRPDHLRETG
jgi:diguanylate cyclase (GGDEF)-like protein